MTLNPGLNFVNRNVIFHENDYLYEELNPDSSESLGGFKTTNPLGDRFQRQMIHTSPTKSKFKKTVELVLCIHGWSNPDRKVPMTLIVLGVNLSCHKRDFRFQSLQIGLRFGEDDQRDAVDTVEACPQVVAYAPFVQEERWNTTAANVNASREYGGSLGVKQFGQTEMSASRKAEVSYMRKHFDRGSAHRLYDDRTGRIYGVEWYCEQNRLENYGVLPNFHLAVLIKRSHDGDRPISFRAEFDMWTEAGFKHDFEQGLRRAFRRLRPADDPVYFDPSKEKPDVYGVVGVGQKLLESIKIDNLGALAVLTEATPVLHPRETLRHAAYVLARTGAPEAAVVNDDGTCLGLIGPSDLLVARLHDLTEATDRDRSLRYLTRVGMQGSK